MGVFLTTSDHAKKIEITDSWCAIDLASNPVPNQKSRLENVRRLLAQSYEEIKGDWLEIGKKLSDEPSAALAHTPACAANISDFGVMLAWSKLIEDWANFPKDIWVICDDPWLSRHVSGFHNVTVLRTPGLKLVSSLWALRGYLARIRSAGRFFIAALKFKSHAILCKNSRSWLLVYGHPRSKSTGEDAYFGDLLGKVPSLNRIIHVDSDIERTSGLADGKRTFSLHGWGNPLFALFVLPFVKWRPRKLTGKPWLLRRAAAIEGRTAQSAAIRWQIHCQANWLKKAGPTAVSWPWENHSWEREFVLEAKSHGVSTIGYQHSTVGKSELNYLPASNANGLDSVPEKIFTSGPATRKRLVSTGVPEDRVEVGGAWRSPAANGPGYSKSAPVFIALPSDPLIAQEMISAIKPLANKGQKFLVKDHPMTGMSFETSKFVERTNSPLEDQNEVSAVIYSSTSVGLDALLLQLPTVEFLPEKKLSLDILPDGIEVPRATADTLASVLASLKRPNLLMREEIYSEPDTRQWAINLKIDQEFVEHSNQ